MTKTIAAVLLFFLPLCFCSGAVTSTKMPDRSGRNDFYASNKEPLLPSPLVKLPAGAVQPEGWLFKQLRLQADGFHGHLTEISRFLKKENNAWLSSDGSGSSGWEEVPYWLKGYLNAAIVLRDEAMLEEAKIWIESAIASQKDDGWFGPDKGRSGLATGLKGRADLWPNMIMLYCLKDYYEFTEDKRVIPLMTNYFRYLAGVPENQFLVGYWPRMRAADMEYCILWLYNRTGDAFLLDLVHKTHRRMARWDEDVINWHNVNMSQAFGGPVTYYQLSKKPGHLQAAERNWRKIRGMYGQVPGGMFGGDENCRKGHTGPRQAVETCGVVEMMLSHETLLQITGNLTWADRCEDVTFNSLPATTTWDMKALRYLTAPNMPLSDCESKAPGIQNGGPMYLMNPHYHRCCQHNMGHGWPYFVQHLWMATPDDGLAAVLYSPSKVTARVGDGTEITVREKTNYPFEGKIIFEIDTPKEVAFPLYLRVPAWCGKGTVRVNDGEKVKTRQGRYMIIDRAWKRGDTVEFVMEMAITLRKWEHNYNTVSVDRGPLTYSLKIRERYVRNGGTDKWPAWEIYPDSPWNYGLVLDAASPAGSFEVREKEWPETDEPFKAGSCPIELVAKGRKIPEWELDQRGLVMDPQASPVLSGEPVETITLVPMGAARLRIASFPVIGAGEDAHKWKMPPPPPPKMASHCHSSDTVTALWDGKVPKDSNDHSIPRFTWWPQRGSGEWVQYNLKEPQTVSSVSVYWFDDTGVGACRVPQSWKVLYKSGKEYKPVTGAKGCTTEKDRFNTAAFDPVKTDSIRVEVKLKPEFSSGILEMRVK